MKLKRRPNDFKVRELLREGVLLKKGDHRLYRVTKRKLTSLEAAQALADLAGVAPGDVALAGLKDRQGVTTQYMSIPRGKPVQHRRPELTIENAGFAAQSLSSADSDGNRFDVVVRDLEPHEVERAQKGVPFVREHGLPNYFDEQRFGNLRHKQGWIVLDLVAGRAEDALKCLLTRVSDHDNDRHRRFKSALYRKWGDWRACRDVAGRFGAHHSIFEHLAKNPGDFGGAFRYLSSRVRLIHLYAYQSHLFNRALALHLDRACGKGGTFTVQSIEGRFVFPKAEVPSPPSWGGTFPLPGARLAGVDHEDQRELFTHVLSRNDLTPDNFVIEGVPGFALKPEPRDLVVRPAQLRLRPPESDPMHDGRKLVKLRFELPRGAYATLVVRRLFGRG